MTECVIIAGFGGQGVMTVGKFAASVAMHEGRQVVYLPSYGAEVRGGTANCNVILSDEPIYSPNIVQADTLIIFNQPSYDKFRPRLKSGGWLILNASMAAPEAALERAHPARCLAIPATQAAAELGNVRVANVILLGAYCAARGLLSPEGVRAEMQRELADGKTHLLQINVQAFQKGLDLAQPFLA